MKQRPGLSKAELQVARVLWELGEATVRQVHDAIGSDRDVEFATVQTFLRRLEQKGYVSSKLSGRASVYRPRVRPKTVIRETVDDLVEHLFDGQAAPLVRHLVEERSLSSEELAELKDLIIRMEAKS